MSGFSASRRTGNQNNHYSTLASFEAAIMAAPAVSAPSRIPSA
jgi:hypothetical protein